MNRTRTAFYSFVWISGSLLLANVFGYLLRLLLARNLSVEEYGLVYSIMAVFGLFGLLLHLGLGEALTREAAITGGKGGLVRLKEAFVWTLLSLYTSSGFLAIVGIIGSGWIARAYIGDATAAVPIAVYAISIFLSPITYLFGALAIGRGRADLNAFFPLTQSILLILGVWLLLPFGVTGVMFAYAATMATMILFSGVLLPRIVPGLWSVRTQLRRSTLSRLVLYGFPVMITVLAGTILTSTDTVLLTLFSSLEQVGMYQAAQPTANILLFFGSVLSTVLLPLFADLWRRKKHTLLSMSVTDLYAYVVLVSLPPIIGVIAFPDILLNLLFGAAYIPATPILRWLAASMIFLTLSAVANATFSGIGTPRQTTYAVILGACVNLIGNLLLIPRFGGVGAAFATFISAGVICVWNSLALRRRLAVVLPIKRWLGGLCAGAIFAMCLFFGRTYLPISSQYVKIVLTVLFAGAMYLVTLFVVRTVTVNELRSLRRRILLSRRS